MGTLPCFQPAAARPGNHHAQAYGVHINGYVRGSDGRLQLWVARRSRTKPTWPSLLDHIAAGGQVCGGAVRPAVCSVQIWVLSLQDMWQWPIPQLHAAGRVVVCRQCCEGVRRGGQHTRSPRQDREGGGRRQLCRCATTWTKPCACASLSVADESFHGGAGMTQQGFKTDTLFCYDLELPSDFQPQPQVMGCQAPH